jgi:hypothetical protein
MKIEVLGIDGLALAAEAWRLSRDVDKPIEWSDVYTVDSPCCEFPSAFLHFHGFSIIDREVLASNRIHTMWARTSFVDSPLKFEVPPTLAPMVDARRHRELRQKMEAGQASGQHQDEWRVFLPLCAATSFVMRVSYRDLVKYSKYFMYLGDIVSPFLCDHFVEVAAQLTQVIDLFTGSRQMSREAKGMMSMPKFLHEGVVLAEPIVDHGGVIVATLDLPVWVRAHFIRHRIITVADTFLELIKQSDVLDLTIDEPVRVKIAAGDEIWQGLLGRRSCWLTGSTLSTGRDPWIKIIDQFTVRFGHHVLPCADGACPHYRDARNRLEGTDPGYPCPRYMNLNNIDKTPWLDKLNQAVKSRSAYWLEEINQ